jgi:O-acetylserine/cysteine efflux transporter
MLALSRRSTRDLAVTPRDILAALSVAVVWGLTFIAIKVGVEEAPPLMLAALRFFFAAVPIVFFVAPPAAPAWTVVLYGLLIGVGQFGVLFIAMREGFPVGLASLVIQVQVFFTILFAWTFLGERPTRPQFLGAALGFMGMAVIGSGRLAGANLGPFLLVILAGLLGLGQRGRQEHGQGRHARLHHLVEPRGAPAARASFARARRD